MKLPAPPTDEPWLRYVSLGGLGEVGMNCAIFEADGRAIVLDCGVTFPDGIHYGIDQIIPDFTPLHQLGDRLEAVVITHGHMDHVGAVPWLLEELDVPIYAPAFALELLKSMLSERDLDFEPRLHVIDTTTELRVGNFELEFPHVNHSVPHAHCVVMRTPCGTFVHTGDFKIDDHPILEDPVDMSRLVGIGNEGVRALFADSTNAQRPGRCGSERDVAAALKSAVRDAEGRVFAALFSSNVFRMHSLIEAARRNGRQVCVMGRSARRSLAIARQCGILPPEPLNTFIDIRDIKNVPDHELLVICTGSQAEPRAALTRIANDDYRGVSFKPSDTVMFSSRVIPGNEHWVYKLYDALERKNVRVMTPSDAPIHCSGHGYQGDMRLMIRMLNPEELVPVHGDHRFQKAHARLGKACGAEATWVLDNGDVLEFTPDETRVVGRIATGRSLIDGQVFDDIDGEAFRKRRQIARSGVVLADLAIDSNTFELARAPAIQQIGAFAEDSFGHELLEECAELAADAWEELEHAQRGNFSHGAELVRRTVRRKLRKTLGRKPVVTVRIHTADGDLGLA